MNCITCKKGFNITEDTNSCYNHLPENYYLDNDTFKRCYYRCNRCFNGSNDNTTMNCLSCISNYYFYRKDTFNCVLRNETQKTNPIEIKPSLFVYLLFVFILFISILIASFFIYCYKCRTIVNKKEENKDEGEKLVGNRPDGKERQSLDINEGKDDRNIKQTELIDQN